ncbi:MAG: hypothetical protein ACFBSE_09240 [Prochloraceae cyanobacterium]
MSDLSLRGCVSLYKIFFVMNHLIWYNASLKEYAMGSIQDFKTEKEKTGHSYTILYKFDQPNYSVAQKIINQLNTAHKEKFFTAA